MCSLCTSSIEVNCGVIDDRTLNHVTVFILYHYHYGKVYHSIDVYNTLL